MKNNYQLMLEEIIEENIKNNKVPTLLLHSCCGPCSSSVLEYLATYFKITVYYYNPNIYPFEEYNKRLMEQSRIINELPSKYPIKFVEGNYENEKYVKMVEGLEKEKEGGKRCFMCYRMRLEESAKLAEKLNYDYFTTTLSVSPYKNAQKINEIGEELSKKYNCKYLYSDFKKKNGYLRSIELSKEYNLYRQDYCGCQYSIKSDSN